MDFIYFLIATGVVGFLFYLGMTWYDLNITMICNAHRGSVLLCSELTCLRTPPSNRTSSYPSLKARESIAGRQHGCRSACVTSFVVSYKPNYLNYNKYFTHNA